MKTNLKKYIILLFVGLISVFNVCQFQVKKNRNIILYNTFLKAKGLINGIARGEGFPEDPNKGENLGELKYERRSETQFYNYEYYEIPDKKINGEQVYIAYKTPVTQVICKGHGSVPCYEGIYLGMSEFIGEVKESEKK